MAAKKKTSRSKTSAAKPAATKKTSKKRGATKSKKATKKAAKKAAKATTKKASKKAAKKTATRAKASAGTGRTTSVAKKSGKKAASKKAGASRSSASSAATRKKVAKKATKSTSTPKKRRVGRPPGSGGKRPGSPKTRKTAREIAKVILDECAKWTRAEGAKQLGLETTDIKNLRAGNPPGLLLMLRLVRRGRIDPAKLIRDKALAKLPSGWSTRTAQQDQIAARIRELAKADDAADLAKKTGLSINTIYQRRVANRRSGLQTVLGFIDAGASPNYIFFGK